VKVGQDFFGVQGEQLRSPILGVSRGEGRQLRGDGRSEMPSKGRLGVLD
jgi:hypothetical protein